jgi:hypothetical protein
VEHHCTQVIAAVPRIAARIIMLDNAWISPVSPRFTDE